VHHRPALCIEEMNLNQQSPLHHSHEFMVQCVATGGPDMEFRWYKDDYLVDTRLADRYMKERFFLRFFGKMENALLRNYVHYFLKKNFPFHKTTRSSGLLFLLSRLWHQILQKN
jgi:hypothetical protein